MCVCVKREREREREKEDLFPSKMREGFHKESWPALRWDDAGVDERGVGNLDGVGLEYWAYFDGWELFKEDNLLMTVFLSTRVR